MRGVIVFFIGLFVLSGIVLFSGVILEPILAVVAADEAVQGMGWDSSAIEITDTIQRWAPLLFVAYLLVWAGAWYFRRELMTSPR